MTNLDRFNEAVAARRPIYAAKLALLFSAGCGSRSNAWAWADRAVAALDRQPKRQARLKDALGSAAWPNLKAGEATL